MFWVEMWATWGLVALILTVKYHYEGVLGPIAVALTLLGMISLSASTTGACLNPAVGISNCFFQYWMRSKFQETTANSLGVTLWIYISAPIVGGVLAGIFSLLDGKAEL